MVRLARLLALTALLMLLAAPAHADDPVGSKACQEGKPTCVDAVIREMTRRFNPLASSCDHDAIFSLTYLRTTQAYRRAISDSRFFSSNAFVNREAAEFASLYFSADTQYRAGRHDLVPSTWRVTFDAAETKKVSAAGNLLLGMNAHISRDLPMVLDQLGLGNKADHDKVNQILATVAEPLLQEIARRFDPSISSSDVPGTRLDNDALLELVFAWREEAWQMATALHTAPTLAAKKLVMAEIEANSAARARSLVSSYTYPPGQSSAQRDAYCATHWDT
jgi:Family of unknown function (DUF5995)